MEYQGHLNDATGIHFTWNKVLSITRVPIPTNITQLRGLVNYYRKFILQAAVKMAPLYKLLEKDQAWVGERNVTVPFKVVKRC